MEDALEVCLADCTKEWEGGKQGKEIRRLDGLVLMYKPRRSHGSFHSSAPTYKISSCTKAWATSMYDLHNMLLYLMQLETSLFVFIAPRLSI